MPKRAHERRTGEELVQRKSRAVSLVSRSSSAKQSPTLDSDTSYKSGNYRLDWDSDFTSTERSEPDRVENSTSSSIIFKHWKTAATDNSAFKCEESGTRNWESTYRGKVGSSQSSCLWLSIHWESLRECSTKVESSLDDQMLEQRINVLILGLFMWTTMNVAMHSGENYNENLIVRRNPHFDELKTLFDITQKLILKQNHEILNISTIERHFTCYMTKYSSWRKQRYTSTQTQFFVWDGCRDIQRSRKSGKISINIFQESNGYKELFGIDRELLEFEWNISQHIHHYRFSMKFRINWKLDKQVQNFWKSNHLHVYAKRHRLGQEKITMNVIRFLSQLRMTQKDVRLNTCLFSVQDKKKNGMKRTSKNLKECGVLPHQFQKHRTSSVPSFQYVGSKIFVKRNKKRKYTIHFSAESLNAELLCRTIKF